ncbi:MAG: NAD(P)-dependent oxidoreductase [Rhodospirillales bacterium]|jgi:3-hydroxyisobutyrate dehydrogenase-like beta-hydroxyacid dehydrogenase|nr:NAD(P)-dependent oxidoreductase [Rhodospirillales bacterium]
MTEIAGKKIGFIGLGLMGKWMSRNLIAAGANVVAYDVSQEALAALAADGASPASSPGDVAARSEIVLFMVTDTAAVETVVLGTDGVAQALAPGGLAIDMGTTLASATKRFAETVTKGGSDYVDGPVSGGEIGARDGSLSIMAGGTDAAFARAKPIFEVLGSNVTHIGGIGAGHVAKAANQVIVGLTLGAVAEAISLARRAGVDPAKVREALMGGFAASRILEVHGQRMIDCDYTPGAHATIQRKDMAQALELGAEYDLELPSTRLNLGLWDKLIEDGGAKLDQAGIIKAIDSQLD